VPEANFFTGRRMAETKRKLVKRKIGDILKIELGDGTHTYARVLHEATFAIYDARTTEELPIEETVERPILFYVAVMNRAVKEKRWLVVGHIHRTTNSPAKNAIANPAWRNPAQDVLDR
jgi:Immunity protein 26